MCLCASAYLIAAAIANSVVSPSPATPSETAGLGAVLAIGLVAVVYRLWRPGQIKPMLVGTLRESTMLMMIIGMSLLYSYVMSYLHISQAAAQAIVALQLSPWFLLATILLMVASQSLPLRS